MTIAVITLLVIDVLHRFSSPIVLWRKIFSFCGKAKTIEIFFDSKQRHLVSIAGNYEFENKERELYQVAVHDLSSLDLLLLWLTKIFALQNSEKVIKLETMKPSLVVDEMFPEGTGLYNEV